jgi:hypothetical protein
VGRAVQQPRVVLRRAGLQILQLRWRALDEEHDYGLRDIGPAVTLKRKRSVKAPAQAAARSVTAGCQFQGRSAVMWRAG